MSDMFFDIPVKGEKYTFGDWKSYAIHDEDHIYGFFGDYRWLSNFHRCSVYFEGLLYPSSENSYQAAKVFPHERKEFVTCSPAQSKNLWKTTYFNGGLLDDTSEQWDERKYDVMSVIVFDKFYRNKHLRLKLIETGQKALVETNHWGDSFWGVDIKKGGKNNLGKILMKIREYWNETR